MVLLQQADIALTSLANPRSLDCGVCECVRACVCGVCMWCVCMCVDG